MSTHLQIGSGSGTIILEIGHDVQTAKNMVRLAEPGVSAGVLVGGKEKGQSVIEYIARRETLDETESAR